MAGEALRCLVIDDGEVRKVAAGSRLAQSRLASVAVEVPPQLSARRAF